MLLSQPERAPPWKVGKETARVSHVHDFATQAVAPLESTTFRQLLAATAISDIGIFMRVTAAACLMLSFGAGPMYVALIQTGSSLPFFLLALPAGSIGDIVDRRN